MKNRIYEYVVLNGSDSVDEYDAPFRSDGVFATRVDVPVSAHVIAVGLDPGDVRVCPDIVAWCIVDPAPDAPTVQREFFLAYTGGFWPERMHLGTLFTGAGQRVVHVFGGGVA